MATKKMPLAALQAPCAYKRNKYRNLAIEYYARNSSSVLALTHERWPQGTWFSFTELAQLFSKEFGWEVDAHSLRRQLRRVKPFDEEVKERVFELIAHFGADGVAHACKKQ